MSQLINSSYSSEGLLYVCRRLAGPSSGPQTLQPCRQRLACPRQVKRFYRVTGVAGRASATSAQPDALRTALPTPVVLDRAEVLGSSSSQLLPHLHGPPSPPPASFTSSHSPQHAFGALDDVTPDIQADAGHHRDDPGWLWEQQVQALNQLHLTVRDDISACDSLDQLLSGLAGQWQQLTQHELLYCLHLMCAFKRSGDYTGAPEEEYDALMDTCIKCESVLPSCSPQELCFMMRCTAIINRITPGLLEGTCTSIQSMLADNKLSPDLAATAVWALARTDKQCERNSTLGALVRWLTELASAQIDPDGSGGRTPQDGSRKRTLTGMESHDRAGVGCGTEFATVNQQAASTSEASTAASMAASVPEATRDAAEVRDATAATAETSDDLGSSPVQLDANSVGVSSQANGREDGSRVSWQGSPSADVARPRLGLSPLNAVMLLWGLGRARMHPRPALVQELVCVLTGEEDLGSLPGRCLSMLLWSLAHLGIHNRKLLDSCCCAILVRVRASSEHQTINHAFNGMPKTQTAESSPEIMHSSEMMHSSEIDPPAYGRPKDSTGVAGTDASGSGCCVAVSVPNSKEVWLLSLADLSSAMWAVGKLEYVHVGLMDVVASFVMRNASLMWHRDIARVLWCYANLGYGHVLRLWRACWASILSRGLIKRFGEQEMTLLLWSTAVSGYNPGTSALLTVAQHVYPKLHKYQLTSLSAIAFVFSRFNCCPPGLFKSVSIALSHCKMDRCKAQYLVSIAHSYAKVGIRDVDLFHNIAHHVAPRAQQLSTSEMIRLLNAFVTVDIHSQKLVDVIDSCYDDRLRSMTPASLTAALQLLARLGEASKRTLQTAEECCMVHVDTMEAQHVSTVCWSFAKLEYRPTDEFLSRTASNMLSRIRTAEGKCVSNLLWAYGKLEYRPETETLQSFADGMSPRLWRYTPQSLANILWAYAKFGYHPEGPFRWDFRTRVLQCKRDIEPVGISSLMWSYATLGYRPPQLFPALVRRTFTLLQYFEGRELSNVLWALGKMHFTPNDDFLEACCVALSLRVPSLQPQELFNVMWALSKMKYTPRCELFDGVAREVALRAFDFKPLELTNTVWAFARLQHRSEEVSLMLHALAAQVPDQLPQFQIRHLATIIWSFGHLGYHHEEVVRLLMGELEDRLKQRAIESQCNTQDVTQLAQGLAKLGYYSLEVMELLEGEVCRQIEDMLPFELAGVLWGFAVLGIVPDRLLEAMENDAPRLSEEFRHHTVPSDMVLAWWALVVFREYGDIFYSLSAGIEQCTHEPTLSLDQLRGLVVAVKVVEAEEGGAPQIKGRLKERCREAMSAQINELPPPLTALQEDVARVCREMGRDVKTQVRIDDLCFSLPVAVALSDSRGVALEVFEVEEVQRGLPGGGVQGLRERLIESRGYHVVRVLAGEWQACNGKGQKEELVKQLIDKVANDKLHYVTT